MGDIFEEVEESIRRDAATRLWARAAPFVIGGAVLLVAAVGAWEANKYFQARAIERDSAAYALSLTAIDKGDFASAKTQLEALAAGSGGFAVLAAQLLPEVERRSGAGPTEVAAALEGASKTEEPLLADIAALKLAYARADSVTGAELDVMLSPLVARGGPIAALARELSAAKAYSEGDAAKARQAYQALSLTLDLPEGLRQRVEQALVIIPAPETPPAETPPAAAETGDPS